MFFTQNVSSGCTTNMLVQGLFAIVVLGLLIFLTYKITWLDTVIKLEKANAIQLAGQSVAIGTMAQCLGCGDQVFARMSSFANLPSDST